VNGAEIARAVRSGTASASAIVAETLARIASVDPELNAFTSVFGERAIARAKAVDADVASGRDPGPLAGVPFAAKNLFDVAGVVTRAGAKVTADDPPAAADAEAVAALERRGAILVGATNMDEFAYGFVTENAHDGPTHNPHDRTRIAGGSSGGSAAAVAAELVPLALASDTNGSIRVRSGRSRGRQPTSARRSPHYRRRMNRRPRSPARGAARGSAAISVRRSCRKPGRPSTSCAPRLERPRSSSSRTRAKRVKRPS
jgi:hypothetical protein